MFILIPDTLSEFVNDIIIFISFSQLLIKIKIVQQNNKIKLNVLNELSINVAFQAIEIFINFDASNIIF